MDARKHLRSAGLAFTGCGIVFLALALASRYATLIAIGPAFVALGLALLGKSQQKDAP